MDKRTLLPTFFALLLLSSCGEDEAFVPRADFTVTYKAEYDGDQLAKYKNYAYGITGYAAQFNYFSTYLSDIELLKSDGTAQRLVETEYLNFFPSNASSDLSTTPSKTYRNVPEGEYVGLRIGYGVKPALNAQTPLDFAFDHPLAIESEYWSGWRSYIFTKIEGKYDPDNNGTLDLGLQYHCGSDAVYKVYSFNQPIHVHAGQPGATVVFDLEKVFTMADGSFYDIATNHITSSSPNEVAIAQVLMTNFERATRVEQ